MNIRFSSFGTNSKFLAHRLYHKLMRMSRVVKIHGFLIGFFPMHCLLESAYLHRMFHFQNIHRCMCMWSWQPNWCKWIACDNVPMCQCSIHFHLWTTRLNVSTREVTRRIFNIFVRFRSYLFWGCMNTKIWKYLPAANGALKSIIRVYFD